MCQRLSEDSGADDDNTDEISESDLSAPAAEAATASWFTLPGIRHEHVFV